MGTYHQYDEVWQFDIKNDVLSMDFTRDSDFTISLAFNQRFIHHLVLGGSPVGWMPKNTTEASASL